MSTPKRTSQREKGKWVGERGEGGDDCGREAGAGGKGEEVWSESRGTPDCCYPTCSPSAGAGILAAAAAAAVGRDTGPEYVGKRRGHTY